MSLAEVPTLESEAGDAALPIAPESEKSLVEVAVQEAIQQNPSAPPEVTISTARRIFLSLASVLFTRGFRR